MRETELWQRLERQFGSAYCRVWAQQTALAKLDGRTVSEALAANIDCKQIWLAVCAVLELPASQR